MQGNLIFITEIMSCHAISGDPHPLSLLLHLHSQLTYNVTDHNNTELATTTTTVNNILQNFDFSRANVFESTFKLQFSQTHA